MPWTADDAYQHSHRARTASQRRRWAAVANRVREDDLQGGMAEGEADAHAIREADAAIRHVASPV